MINDVMLYSVDQEKGLQNSLWFSAIKQIFDATFAKLWCAQCKNYSGICFLSLPKCVHLGITAGLQK